MHAIRTLRFLAADVVSRDPGLGHYLRYGGILLATVVLVSAWMIRTWRHAPDPDERWREARQDRSEHEDASSRH